jgi:hypothetical protein
VRTRLPHDSLRAAYDESLPRFLSAAKQALEDYQTLYPNNNAANLMGKDFDDMARSLWESVEVEVLKPWRLDFMEGLKNGRKK